MPGKIITAVVCTLGILGSLAGPRAEVWAGTGDAVLLEFSSSGCAPCQAMKPVVSELIARGVPVRQVDVAAETNLARRYGIRSTPTYIVLNGGREVTRLTGMQSAQELFAALEVNPAGPLIPTNSELRHQGPAQPQTRLTPLATQRNDFSHSPSHSLRQQRAEPASTAAPADEQTTWTSAAATAGHSDPAAEPLPSAALAGAIERARAATVRLRVHEGRGFGAGTGTIIDTHGEEALVMTCGHLFRESAGKGRIEVDLFIRGDVVTVEGQLIDYDADQRDIALVAIRPGFPVKPVSVIASNDHIRTGQAVFSFGCDRGDDPSRRDTRITGVDKYNQNIGASNIEIAGAPIDGRSGGGLFDEQGRLIAVCNAADYKSDLGIYAGPGAIRWQLDRVQLARLYESSDSSPHAAGVHPNAVASSPLANPGANATGTATLSPAATPGAVAPAATSPAAAGEMIVILREADGTTNHQVLTLNDPDADLVARIRAAAHR